MVILSGVRCRFAYGPADALPLTISCSSKSRLVLSSWYQLTRVVPVTVGHKMVVVVVVIVVVIAEIVSGSGILPQKTMPASHHSVFYRPDAFTAAKPTASKH